MSYKYQKVFQHSSMMIIDKRILLQSNWSRKRSSHQVTLSDGQPTLNDEIVSNKRLETSPSVEFGSEKRNKINSAYNDAMLIEKEFNAEKPAQS